MPETPENERDLCHSPNIIPKERERLLRARRRELTTGDQLFVEAGAHRIVMPVIASEFHVLCEDERKRVAEIVVEETRRRIPTVIGVL